MDAPISHEWTRDVLNSFYITEKKKNPFAHGEKLQIQRVALTDVQDMDDVTKGRNPGVTVSQRSSLTNQLCHCFFSEWSKFRWQTSKFRTCDSIYVH